MDKYIDVFVDKYFSEFEGLGHKNARDEFFDNPPMKPRQFSKIAWFCSLILMGLSFFISFPDAVKSELLSNVGIGLFTGSIVAIYFNQQEKSRRYYGEIVKVIDARSRSIKMARKEANERLMNVSCWEGQQLLQMVVQNAYEFCGCLEDKLGHKISLRLVDGISLQIVTENSLSQEEMWKNIQDNRNRIRMLCLRLEDAKMSIGKCAMG